MQSVNISVTKGDKALGGLLRDMWELLSEIPALPASERSYWEHLHLLREKINEVYPV